VYYTQKGRDVSNFLSTSGQNKGLPKGRKMKISPYSPEGDIKTFAWQFLVKQSKISLFGSKLRKGCQSESEGVAGNWPFQSLQIGIKSRKILLIILILIYMITLNSGLASGEDRKS